MLHSITPYDQTRRTFLKTGVTAAAAAGLPLAALGDETQTEPKEPLPRRVLGRTGEKVTILNLGAGRPPNERQLNAAYDAGVRYIDTAATYGAGASERAIAEWMNKTGHRKEFFIVTKESPRYPASWPKTINRRLKALQTDTIDLFLLSGLGDNVRDGEEESARNVPKMKEWADAAEQLKKTGKVRFVGFSTHTAMPLRIGLLNSAAEGGWADAIMVAYDPKIVRENAEFNKALDACHKAGIGLICMKEMRGLDEMPKLLPEFEELGLTAHQAVLHAVWSDERIASICSDMPNIPILTENAAAARNFKPLDKLKIGAVIDLYQRYAVRYCNGCDGRCRRAGGTKAALADMTRALSYYEQDGLRNEARKLYASLTPDQRDWNGADLAAASNACVCKLDFASLLPRAEEKLA